MFTESPDTVLPTLRECDYRKKRELYTLPQSVPRIRLVGRWLEQAGFKPHSRVRV
nr:SymE family type I addiction module toxin [Caballeronia sp. GAWG2-1]